MSITFDRRVITDAAIKAGSIVARNSPKPILRNLSIRARDGAAIIHATNLEQVVEAKLPCSGSCDPFLISAEKLVAALRTCVGDEVELEPNQSGVSVKCGRAKWQFGSEKHAEFPVCKIPDAKVRLQLPVATIRGLLTVSWCNDEGNARYAMGGLRIESGNGTLAAVATNGRMISWLELPTEPDQICECLIPASGVKAMNRILLDDGEAELRIGDWVSLVCGNSAVATRQLEGRFPMWRQVIATKNTFDTEIDAAAISRAVQQARVSLGECVGASLCFSPGDLSISIRSSGDGMSSDANLPINWDHAPMKLTVDINYLSDALRNAGDGLLKVRVHSDSFDSYLILESERMKFKQMGMEANQ